MDTVDDLDPRQLLQSLTTGVAVAEPASLTIGFENAVFFEWFPPSPDADETLPNRLPKFDADKARSRLADRRVFQFETESRSEARSVPVRVEIRLLRLGDRDVLVVECRDISKQKEAEYMLDSYSRLSERHRRDLEKEKERVERLLLNIMPKAVYECASAATLNAGTPRIRSSGAAASASTRVR